MPENTQPDANVVVPPSIAIPQDNQQVEDEVDDEPNGPITVTPEGEKNKQQD